ncbi:uncharacterized protein LOC135695784 isoform X1 [Rhopilema esculentum]|uniref:uncharacterized protein LOC135695784 isoform X1 n=1 Tax=Rhopilema esculentum TaxID=499914 RepID=UPI0031D84AC2
MSEVKMDQEYNEDVEQKFGVQRDAMEDEEDDTQIVEDEIPPPQMDFFDEIADEENTQIMADEILQITPSKCPLSFIIIKYIDTFMLRIIQFYEHPILDLARLIVVLCPL